MQPRSNIMSISRHVLLIHCPFYRPRDLEFVRNSFAVTMSIPTPSILSLLRDPAFFQGQRILNTVSTCPPRSQIARITILSPPYRGDLNATRVFRPPPFLFPLASISLIEDRPLFDDIKIVFYNRAAAWIISGTERFQVLECLRPSILMQRDYDAFMNPRYDDLFVSLFCFAFSFLGYDCLMMIIFEVRIWGMLK